MRSNSSRPAASSTVLSVLLALALLWQPLVQAASEIHESAHPVQADHHHDGDPGGRIHDHSAPDHDRLASDHERAADLPEESGVCHGMLHMVHCCGHAPAMLGATLLPPGIPAATAPPASAAAGVPDLAIGKPLRPPIGS